jgi:endonuclease IV
MQITLHPGAHVGAGEKAGLDQIIKGLNEVLISSRKNCTAKGNISGFLVFPRLMIYGACMTMFDKPCSFINSLRDEIMRAEALGAMQITLHPGAHVGAGEKAGLDQISLPVLLLA